MNFRMIVAIIFLVLLIACGIFQEFYIEKVFADFNAMLDEISNTPNEYYSLEKIDETREWWKKRTRQMEYFMPHAPLYEITATFGELNGAVIINDYETATAMLHRLKLSVDILREMTGIRLGNIL